MRKRIFLMLAASWFMAGEILAQDFERVQFFQLPPAGQVKGREVEGSLRFDDKTKGLVFMEKGGREMFSTPYTAIRTLTYERAARPRYWLGLVAREFLFTREKKHFLTIQYGPEGSGQYALLRLHKNNFRHVLAMLESGTGKKIEHIEEH